MTAGVPSDVELAEIPRVGVATEPCTRFKEWRRRVHERVCTPGRSCTCPDVYQREQLTEARDLARRIHVKFGHPGSPERCRDLHDSICKAVWPL